MAVLLITTLIFTVHTGILAERNWNFDITDDIRGPSHWKDNYPDCGGKRQSPVAIHTNQTVGNGQLAEFVLANYENTKPSLTLTNDGFRVKVLVSGDRPTVSGGGLGFKYEMNQFHFHWSTNNKHGSEHKLDDGEYAGELHIGHLKQGSAASSAYSDPRGLAVLAVLLKAGGVQDNPAYEKIFRHLDKIQNAGDEYAMPSFAIRDLLPVNLNKYYRYNGSRAAPPCEEAAIWSVFQEAVTLSDNQFERLRQLKNGDNPLLHNNRPVAPLCDRKIYSSWKDNSKDGSTGRACRLNAENTIFIVITMAACFLVPMF